MLNLEGILGGCAIMSMPVGTSRCTYLFTSEERILHMWISGLVVHPLRWGEAGSKIGEPAHDATVAMSPFWKYPSRGGGGCGRQRGVILQLINQTVTADASAL